MNGLCIEDPSVGQAAKLTRRVSAGDLDAFAAVTGDNNPVHLDQAHVAATPFGERIAHGMLATGYISAVVGTKLPGPGAISISQTLRFRRPVRIGDAVTARAETIVLDEPRACVTLKTTCSVNGKAVVEGEAEVMVPRRGARAAR